MSPAYLISKDQNIFSIDSFLLPHKKPVMNAESATSLQKNKRESLSSILGKIEISKLQLGLCQCHLQKYQMQNSRRQNYTPSPKEQLITPRPFFPITVTGKLDWFFLLALTHKLLLS